MPVTAAAEDPFLSGQTSWWSADRPASTDPGRALLTGFVTGPNPFDDWNKFDVPTVRGIARTAPYVHNNSAATLEEVVDHYIELFKFIKANTPAGVPPPPVASTDGVNFDRQPTPEERCWRICGSCNRIGESEDQYR